MRIAKIRLEGGDRRIALTDDQEVQLLDLTQVGGIRTLSDILYSKDPSGLAKFLIDRDSRPIARHVVRFDAPIDQQEVWAAGVTYQRSQAARMEESQTAASHYDRVYSADRPELFFKATPSRVSGNDDPVRIRSDSTWTVPEPEVALVVSPEGKLVGLTIGNDMSARDIEGENPLYLPQAKFYRDCCALGPDVVLAAHAPARAELGIEMTIHRGQEAVYQESTSAGEMVREFDELISWLMRDNDFPDGAVLLTGTGLVPPDEFSLQEGDVVSIRVDGVGTLTNPVMKSA